MVSLIYYILAEFFWDFEQLRYVSIVFAAYLIVNANTVFRAIYQRCRRMVDIDQRVEIVNMRLDVVRELLEILRVELSEQHGTRLEVHTTLTISSL